MDNIHIGLAIEQRINEMGISKAEFARMTGIPKQNVNRILERASIDTARLAQISEALQFNFFTLYCETGATAIADNHSVAAVNSKVSAVSSDGKVAYLERIIEEKERLIQILLAQGKGDNTPP